MNTPAMPPTDTRVLTGSRFLMAVRAALGITTPGQRVIIDAPCDGPVKVYFQGIGTEKLLDLDLKALLDGAELTFVPEATPP